MITVLLWGDLITVQLRDGCFKINRGMSLLLLTCYMSHCFKTQIENCFYGFYDMLYKCKINLILSTIGFF